MTLLNRLPDRPPTEGWTLSSTITETTTHTHTTQERVTVLPSPAPRVDAKRSWSELLASLAKALRWLPIVLGALTCCS